MISNLLMSVGIFSVFQTKHFIAQKYCTTGSYKVSFSGNVLRVCVSQNTKTFKAIIMFKNSYVIILQQLENFSA